MDFTILQIVIISVVSPILLAVGILYILTTAQINAAGIAANSLAVAFGGLQFAFGGIPRVRGALTLSFCFFLALALTADTRLGRRYIAERKKKPIARRIEVESHNAWVVNKPADEEMVYRIPGVFLKNHPEYLGSDLQFRITCESSVDPFGGSFAVDGNANIAIPPNILPKLNESQMIRFEIIDSV